MLTNIERETIITFNEAEELAEVFTFNAPMQRRLAELAKQRPADVIQIERDDTDGQTSVTYTVPKKWVAIKAPRVLSEKQLEQIRAARMNVKTGNGAPKTAKNSLDTQQAEHPNGAEQ